MSDNNLEVASQYNQWPYPQPISDLEERARTSTDIVDPSRYWPLIWPRRRSAEGLTILVAGCGSYQAAFLAFNNPTCQVVGIDLSPASLDHHANLKRRFNLKNLTLFEKRVQDVGSLGMRFDYIVCTGVLHHLSCPSEGLCALRGVLAPGGAISLGLYRKSGRNGIYPLQEAFRILKLQREQGDVDIVKSVLGALPATHSVKPYLSTVDVTYDAGIVDSFLHSQDRAFSVHEVYQLVNSCGLSFFTWLNRRVYMLSSVFPQDHPIMAKARNLCPMNEAHITDIFRQDIDMHCFVVADPDAVSQNQIDFEGDAWHGFRLLPNPDLRVLDPGNPDESKPAVMERDGHRFIVPESILKVLRLSLGGDTLGKILHSMISPEKPAPHFEAVVKSAVHKLWKLNHFFVLLPEEPPKSTMQDRVPGDN